MIKSKGFTLIELLAVIAVLFLIMFIATTSILYIIENSRRNAFEVSAMGLIKTAQNEYNNTTLKKSSVPPTEYIFENDSLVQGELSFSGKAPKSGNIITKSDGTIAIAIHDGTWCASKSFNKNDRVKTTKVSADVCFVYYSPEELPSKEDNEDCVGGVCKIVVEDPKAIAITPEKIEEYNSCENKISTFDERCKIKPFHLNRNTSSTEITYNCGLGDQTLSINHNQFEYGNQTGIGYSNNERTESYICSSGTWSRQKLWSAYNNKNMWDNCLRNLNGHCSGFPAYITLNDNEHTIKLWRTDKDPQNLVAPTINKTGYVELERSNPLSIVDGGACATEDQVGTITIYEAPVYEGLRYTIESEETIVEDTEECFVVELHPCEIGENDPFVIPGEAVLFDAIDWGGNIASYRCEHVMYFALEGGTNGVMRNFGSTENWNIIPDSVTLGIFGDGIEVIGDYAFVSDNFEKLYLPDTLISINRNAFQQTNTQNLTIPNSVISIGNYAFMQNAITELDLGTGIQSIGTGAFYNNKISELRIPDSVTTLSLQAFERNEIKTLYIGNSLGSLGQSAFENNQIDEIHWGSSLFNIGNFAFANNNLTSVTIPSTVTTIRYYAFQYNYLENVTFTRTDNTNSMEYAFRFNGPNKNSTAPQLNNVNTNLSGTWTLSPDGTSWSR